MQDSQDYPLFETIAIVDGQWQNLAWHQRRYENALLHHFGKNVSYYQFAEVTIPTEFKQGLIRCRIDYNRDQLKVQFFPYQRRQIRTFQAVHCDHIDYSFKYSDRSLLEQLYAKRGDCDEIMIIQHGLVTDCSIGNPIFRQKEQWYTPKKPLLAGTQRAKLLEQGIIVEKDILLKDVALFDEIKVINAMNPLVI